MDLTTVKVPGLGYSLYLGVVEPYVGVVQPVDVVIQSINVGIESLFVVAAVNETVRPEVVQDVGLGTLVELVQSRSLVERRVLATHLHSGRHTLSSSSSSSFDEQLSKRNLYRVEEKRINQTVFV